MSEPKTRPADQTFEDFVAQQPEARRDECRMLDALMRKATGKDSVRWGSIVGYGRYANTPSDGKVDAWPLAGFSPRKQALAVYLVPGFDRDEARMAKLGKHSASKSCLYIKRLADIDMNVLEHLVKASVRAMERVRIHT